MVREYVMMCAVVEGARARIHQSGTHVGGGVELGSLWEIQAPCFRFRKSHLLFLSCFVFSLLFIFRDCR